MKSSLMMGPPDYTLEMFLSHKLIRQQKIESDLHWKQTNTFGVHTPCSTEEKPIKPITRQLNCSLDDQHKQITWSGINHLLSWKNRKPAA